MRKKKENYDDMLCSKLLMFNLTEFLYFQFQELVLSTKTEDFPNLDNS